MCECACLDVFECLWGFKCMCQSVCWRMIEDENVSNTAIITSIVSLLLPLLFEVLV